MKINGLSSSVQSQLQKIAAKDGQSGNLSALDLKRASADDLRSLMAKMQENGIDENEAELMALIRELAQEKNISSGQVQFKDGVAMTRGQVKSYDFESGQVNSVDFEMQMQDIRGTDTKLSAVRSQFQERDWKYYLGNVAGAVGVGVEFNNSGTDVFFKALEKKGVVLNKNDMTAIITSRLQQGKSPKEIVAALQAYGIIQEAKHMGIPGSDELIAVEERLKNGALHFNPNASNAPGVSVYDSDTNTIEQKAMNIGNIAQRALFLHELMHAGQDIAHAGDKHGEHTHGEIELEAYLAQGLYALKSKPNISFDDPTLQLVLGYARAYSSPNYGPNHEITRDLAQDLANHLKQKSQYKGKWDKPSISNGIN